jgi:ribonuclease G
MAKNLLVINVDLRETRVALIEDGIIAELHLERASSRGTLGNIVAGKVTRVLPGMQAAFIDIGLERAAFLHVEDLIRPDDFEAYLGGGKRPDEEEAPTEPAAGLQEADASADVEETAPAEDAGGAAEEGSPDSAEGEADVLEVEEIDADEPDLAAEPDLEGEADLASEAPAEADEDAAPGVNPGLELAAAPTEQVVAPRPSSPRTPAPPPPRRAQGGGASGAVEAVGRSEHRFRSKRMSRRGGRNKQNGKSAHGRPRNGQRDASRLSRSTPIREVVREGQEVIVQISKEPIGTKGARVTSHISLPGRYVVYMPTLDQIGISKRIGSDKERARLREAIEGIKPPTGGLIVRTVAEGLTKKQLKADVGYLVRLWAEVAKKRESGAKPPSLLYQELDLVLKTARDLFSDEIEQIVIDDREQYQRLIRFVEMFMPERAKDIVLYSGDEPIFDAYGIEDEIGRALSRKVPLPSGGYLIIDQAEALTAIDVNTGRYVGKGSKDLEDTLFKTNMEAVEEIAYQLRFRNLGGLIVLDLIDMERASNREKIRRRLEELLQKDKAKTTLNRISDLGLIEMTRKRTRESLGRLLHEPCFYCDGTGQLQSKQTIAYEILRQIRRDRAFLPGYSVVVNAHPAVIDIMKGDEREAVQEAERRFMRRIELVPRREYHLEQFDLTGK